MLDASAPSLEDGTISTAATAYTSGAVTLNSNTGVNIRVLKGGVWLVARLCAR